MVVFASDHAHFAFNFGTSMRQAIAAKEPEPPHVLGLFNNGEWHPLQLSGAPSDFHPHGLAARGSLRNGGELLVVNRRSTHDTARALRRRGWRAHDAPLADRIARTDVQPQRLRLRGGEPEVYRTNWRSYETGTLKIVEVYGQGPWSYVVRCHLLEHTCEKVADGIKMANGIEMRGSHVIVVSSLRRPSSSTRRRTATAARWRSRTRSGREARATTRVGRRALALRCVPPEGTHVREALQSADEARCAVRGLARGRDAQRVAHVEADRLHGQHRLRV